MSFLTYLAHYTVARLLYDEVVRRAGLISVAVVGLAFALILIRRRRSRR